MVRAAPIAVTGSPVTGSLTATKSNFGRFDFVHPRRTCADSPYSSSAPTTRWGAVFPKGYGTDPWDEELWRIMLLREAIGMAVWAFQVGDATFEAQGHRVLTEGIARFLR